MKALLPVLLLFVSPVFADLNCETSLLRSGRSIHQALESAFTDPRIYEENRCGKNVAVFLKQLIREGMDASAAQVLFFTHEMARSGPVPVDFKSQIAPACARGQWQGHEPRWSFHVALMISETGGTRKILDLSYKDQPVEMDTYFQEMFPSKEGDRLSRLFLTVIPGAEYLKEYEALGPGGSAKKYMETPDEKQFSARDLLQHPKPAG